MSNFSFIDDKVLQSNLVLAFNHVVDLTTLSGSKQYGGSEKRPLLGSLRKTIVIHTASIVEALLLWRLKKECNTNKIELADEWKYFNINTLYKIDESEEIIAGRRKKEKKELDKLDFVRITDLCIKYKILSLRSIKADIDHVRELRNRLHIGGLAEIEREYSKNDLEFCFSVTRKVIKIVSA